jgi:hypothetical protein
MARHPLTPRNSQFWRCHLKVVSYKPAMGSVNLAE